MWPLKLLPLSLDMIKPWRHHIHTNIWKHTRKTIVFKEILARYVPNGTSPHVFPDKGNPCQRETLHSNSTANSREPQMLLNTFPLHSSLTKHENNNIYNAGRGSDTGTKKTKHRLMLEKKQPVEQRKIRFGWKCRVHLTLWLSRVISFQQPKKDRDKGGQYVTFWQKAQLTYANMTKKRSMLNPQLIWNYILQPLQRNTT